MQRGIRRRLALTFLVLATGPMLLLGLVLAWQTYNAQVRQAIASQHVTASGLSTQVTAFLQSLEDDLYVTSHGLLLPGLSRDQQNVLLSELWTYQPALEDIALLDRNGQELARVTRGAVIPATGLRSRADGLAFQRPKESGQGYYSSVRFDGQTGEPFMTVAFPLHNAGNGSFAGVLVATVRLGEVSALITGKQLDAGESVYIVDSDNNVVVHPDTVLVLRGTGFALPGVEGRAIGLTGARVMLSFSRFSLGDRGFAVVVEKTEGEALSLAISTIRIIAVLVAVSLVIGGLLGLLAVRQIVRPIEGLAATAEAIRCGDLQRRAHVATRDELGTLAQAFNGMTERLQGFISDLEQRVAAEQMIVQRYAEHMGEVERGNLAARADLSVPGRAENDSLVRLGRSLNEMSAGLQHIMVQIRDTAAGLTSSASEILAATAQQASGASEQSAAIVQASATIDEVRAIAGQTAQLAQNVAERAGHVAVASQSGRDAVKATVAGIEQVKQKVEAIATDILTLSEQAQAIGQIIAAVSDIAAQSNMLALNAAVEAARAGEAGRGFAVVAGEVRGLAEQSHLATAQVKEILTEIQRGVNTAVMATEEGMKQAGAGMRLVEESGEAIRRLAEGVEESAQAAGQIAAAADQQLMGMEQIALAMENIQQVTAQTLASARQSEHEAEELHALAGQMRQLVAQYRL